MNTPSGVQRKSDLIPLETLADYLSASVIIEKFNLGSTLVHRVRHPEVGEIILINTAGDNNLILHV